MSVLIFPMPNPIEVVKEIAGADVLWQGRMIFGVGVGEFTEEFDEPYLIIDAIPESIANVLSTFECFAQEVMPAVR